jgi:hypothetical protein
MFSGITCGSLVAMSVRAVCISLSSLYALSLFASTTFSRTSSDILGTHGSGNCSFTPGKHLNKSKNSV